MRIVRRSAVAALWTVGLTAGAVVLVSVAALSFLGFLAAL
jgi:hypothetical protein